MWFPCQLDTSVSTVPNIFTLIWGNLHGHPPLNLWISQRPMVQDTGGFFSRNIYPPVICYIAIENGPFIVDLPMTKHGDFP